VAQKPEFVRQSGWHAPSAQTPPAPQGCVSSQSRMHASSTHADPSGHPVPHGCVQKPFVAPARLRHTSAPPHAAFDVQTLPNDATPEPSAHRPDVQAEPSQQSAPAAHLPPRSTHRARQIFVAAEGSLPQNGASAQQPPADCPVVQPPPVQSFAAHTPSAHESPSQQSSGAPQPSPFATHAGPVPPPSGVPEPGSGSC